MRKLGIGSVLYFAELGKGVRRVQVPLVPATQGEGRPKASPIPNLNKQDKG